MIHSWWFQYVAVVAICVVYALIFGEVRWKRWTLLFALLGMCFLCYWSTWTEQDLVISADLQVIAASRHIPPPDRWWRFH
jgi:phosphoglycerol transferase MdoB-like AlkP superfamily enzyme